VIYGAYYGQNYGRESDIQYLSMRAMNALDDDKRPANILSGMPG